MPEEITPEKMEEIKSSEGVWIVDYWADWCAPCKKLAPIFEEVSGEMKYNFGKVDMEEHQQIGTQEGVRALPTLVIYKDGEEVARRPGFVPKDNLVSWINENV
ncbi:MAG: thioredoxin [Candidatus Nanohaloarchaea archaeon]